MSLECLGMSQPGKRKQKEGVRLIYIDTTSNIFNILASETTIYFFSNCDSLSQIWSSQQSAQVIQGYITPSLRITGKCKKLWHVTPLM